MRSRARSAAGSAMVVVRHCFLRRLQPGGAHEPGDLSLSAGDVLAADGLVDPGRPAGAVRSPVDADDLRGVGGGPLRGDTIAALAAGGTGDLQQAARALDAVACSLSASMKGCALTGSPWQKGVARSRTSTSARGDLFSRRSRASSARSSVDRPGRSPASVSAWATQAPVPRSRSGRSRGRPARSYGHRPGTAPRSPP